MSNKNDNLALNQIHLPNKVGVIGTGMIDNNALLSETLQTQVVRSNTVVPKLANEVQGYLGWGNKKSYHRAKHRANQLDLPVFSIEDGFLRSIDSGIKSRYALSMIIDDLGIYYNTTAPSRLESMICHRYIPDNWTKQHIIYSQQLIHSIIDLQLSKYNDTQDCPNLDNLAKQNLSQHLLKNLQNKNPQSQAEHILLIDQVLGDESLAGSCIDERLAKKQFTRMLKDVFRNHPKAYIWIKAHPAGKKGYLTSRKLIRLLDKYKNRIHILTDSMNPIALIKQVNHVYTVSSHMGFEALMLSSQGYDIRVHCYGVSWYAGWGVTDDSGISGNIKKLLTQVKQRRLETVNHLSNPSEVVQLKNLSVSIEQLFFSAYLDYSHYVDPASQQSADIQSAILWLKTNRHWHNLCRGKLTVYEFSRWKLPFVSSFLSFPNTNLFIKPKPRLKNVLHPAHYRLDLQNPLLVWGLSQRQKLSEILKTKLSEKSLNTPHLHCMEDGFIRSNGLGATLLEPLSVVIDKQGIYYNARQISDLECLLKNCQQLNDAQKHRVSNLKKLLLELNVSKYNVGKRLSATENKQKNSWLQTLQSTTSKKVLIVGQVEDDLSVQYCGSLITTNAGLIRRVRDDNPEAFLVYKPHPDVEAGLRMGKVNKQVLKSVNAVASNLSMPDCLTVIDEVHTISSLTGFEALLRNKKVVCYGLPFYAGWGLTQDMDSHLEPKSGYLARRQRDDSDMLSLEQLIYCTLIDYPLYRLPNGYGLAQVEQVIDYLYRHSVVKNADKLAVDSVTVNMAKDVAKKRIDKSVRIQRPSTKKITILAKTRFMQARHLLLSSLKDK